jgi:hypothetical protein
MAVPEVDVSGEDSCFSFIFAIQQCDLIGRNVAAWAHFFLINIAKIIWAQFLFLKIRPKFN